jgi:hypothetical protein
MPARGATVALLLASAALLAACGGGDGPSADEALKEFSAFDKAAVRSHNAVTPAFNRTYDCLHNSPPPAWGNCAGEAKAYTAAIVREQRRLKKAYQDAPDYAKKIYGDFYRAHRQANVADLAYAKGVLDITRHMKSIDVPGAQDALARMNRAADKSKRLDARTERLLDKARAESEDYVREL